MKRVFLAIALLCAPTTINAKQITVLYPEDTCSEILSQEYSTGGGETMWQYLEVLCKGSDGAYTGLVAEWVSVSGLLGLGRITIPDAFQYVPYSGTTLKVK